MSDPSNVLIEELSVLEGQKLNRSLPVFEQADGVCLHRNGKTFLTFSSNNYLGLSRHPQVLEAVRQVLEHWGMGAAASRLIGGTFIIHRDLEQALAAFMKTESALVYPTGYMTNLGVITALAGEGDAIVMDRLCHASLIDAARLSGARLFVYSHANPEEAEKALKRATSYRRSLLVSDSLFSMDGDFAPLAELAQLARRYDAISVLDEAHALGIWGDGGRGARFRDVIARSPQATAAIPEVKFEIASSAIPCNEVGRPPRNDNNGWDVVVGTLSKALGSQGGFACGSRVLIDTLVNKSRPFIYTTGLSPACVAAAHASLSVIQETPALRERVQRLAQKLREGLRTRDFNILKSESQIVPILLGTAERALACSAYLESQGIYAPAIRPPTVHEGECRIRFSVTAEHSEEDINRLLAVLSETLTS